MMTLSWPAKPALAIATFCALIAAPQYVPSLHNWRIFEWSTVSAVLDFQPRKNAAAPIEEELARLRPDRIQSDGVERIYDPNATMDSFYDALFQLERGADSEVVRILHYGDSPTTADLITSDLRQSLQIKFGDAGHGTYLIARPWAWYNHRGLDVEAQGWAISPATLRGVKDGIYGLAGVSFEGNAGAWSRVTLRRPGHTSVKVSYFAQPGGGAATLFADGERIGELDTEASESGESTQRFQLLPQAKKVELRVTRGTVRLFGYTFEKDSPGVIYDSLGLNGVSAMAFVYHLDPAQWSREIRDADPGLVVVNLGTNESGFSRYVDTTYHNDIRTMYRRIKAAAPNTPVLIMAPMDRGVRIQGGTIDTIPSLPRLISVQAKVAAEEGCAFFNTFEAMGGPGTMGKWYMAEPRLVSADFIHPLPTGGRIVASLLYEAMMRDYNLYKLKVLRRRMAEVRQ